MRIILFVTVVLFIWAQVTAQGIQYNDDLIDDKNYSESSDLTNAYDDNNNLRSLNDLKNKIKTGISVAWDIFKRISKNTNAQLKAWIDKVKDKINKANKVFTESLDKMKNEFNDIVTKIIATGENLKTCLKEHKNNIQNIFKGIASNVKNCVAHNIKNMSKIEQSHVLLSIDDTIFLATMQNKFDDSCNGDNEKCLRDVKNAVTEIENTAQSIEQKYVLARNEIDDHLENALVCITEGITVAAKSIINEAIEIIKCVKNKGH